MATVAVKAKVKTIYEGLIHEVGEVFNVAEEHIDHVLQGGAVEKATAAEAKKAAKQDDGSGDE